LFCFFGGERDLDAFFFSFVIVGCGIIDSFSPLQGAKRIRISPRRRVFIH